MSLNFGSGANGIFLGCDLRIVLFYYINNLKRCSLLSIIF